MTRTHIDTEWGAVFAQLRDLDQLSETETALFDPSASTRAGDVIAKAMLGHEYWELQRVYCGDPRRRTLG
jgi:hypothetical protein